MNQEINFKGLSLTPDDHHTATGELSLCANVELHNGALRPSVLDGTPVSNTLKVDTSVATLLYVHTANGYTHLIASVGKKLYWFMEDGTLGNSAPINEFTADIYNVRSLGNTLIILASDGLYYAVYKDAGYMFLGQKPPFIDIEFAATTVLGKTVRESFDLDGDMDDWFDYDNPSQNPLRCDVKEEKQSDFTEKVYAVLNKMQAEIQEDNRFYAPFFVRYAYKMYNNTSYFMHSAPVFVPVAMPFHDFVIVPLKKNGNDGLQADGREVNVFTHSAELFYRITDANLLEALKDWRDIITSVDIFLSPQFVRTRQGELIKSVSIGNVDSCCSYIDAPLDDVSLGTFRPHTFGNTGYGSESNAHAGLPPKEYGSESNAHADLPLKEDGKYLDEIMSPVFYKMASFALNDGISDLIPSTLTSFPFADKKLSNLVTFDQMPDEYLSHNTLIPASNKSNIYCFNQKISLFGLQEKLFHGFHVESLITKTCHGFQFENITIRYADAVKVDAVFVILKTESGEKTVKVLEPSKTESGEDAFITTTLLQNTFLYYPDARAVSMIIAGLAYNEGADDYINNCKLTLPMKGSFTLNGSFTQKEYTYEDLSLAFDADVDDIVPIPNKLYSSETGNPFIFPAEGIVTVGLGSIIGIAGITRALSPGQMGIHKVMAFCTDGIWALTVNNATGNFATADRLSFDVCVNPTSICQLGQSVLFAADRGMSMVTESNVTPVSGLLDGPMFDIAKLSGLEIPGNISDLASFSTHPFDFFKSARLIYDFANARVLCVNEASQFAYVYSLTDATWSSMKLPQVPLSVISASPYPYFQAPNGSVKRLDKTYAFNDTGATTGIVITRTLSWSSLMQVIQGFQQIHDIPMSNASTLVLYGSNNNITWNYIGRSQRSHASYLPAHPYRFFRIALILSMTRACQYSKLILSVIEKYQHL